MFGQLLLDAGEDRGVAEPRGLEFEVPAPDERIGRFVEVGEHLFHHAPRLELGEPGATGQVCDQRCEVGSILHGEILPMVVQIGRILPEFGQKKLDQGAPATRMH